MPTVSSRKHSYPQEDTLWSKGGNHTDLSPADIHIWRIDVSKHFHELFRKNRHLLKNEDYNKAKRFHRASDYKSFITGRILLRIMCGRYLSISASEALFYRINGKPFIANAPLKFNMSYSENHLLMSFGLCETGIDVEYIQPSFDFQEILMSCFSNEEIATLWKEKQNQKHFFLQWTRKEALLKFTGQGIVDDLKIIPSLDGDHHTDGKGLKTDTDIKLLSFYFEPDYVGTVAYPKEIENIEFIEWED